MTPAEFKARYPAFTSVADATVQIYLDEAATLLDVCRWDELYSQGQGLLTAHELTLNAATQSTQTSGVADDMSVQKAGDVSYTRDASLLAKQMENPYMRTTYGQRYLYLLAQVGSGIMAV